MFEGDIGYLCSPMEMTRLTNKNELKNSTIHINKIYVVPVSCNILTMQFDTQTLAPILSLISMRFYFSVIDNINNSNCYNHGKTLK